jgi:2-dehydro-3-deoxyphosphogalactonate aldolase
VRTLLEALEPLPYIAILRGIRPVEVLEIGAALVNAGIGAIEIPLNSPDPLESIALLAEHFGDNTLIGCGTVISELDLRASHAAGARLVLHPHADRALVRVAKSLDMISVPGVATPTEAYAMLEAGADALKFFPSEIITPPAVAAIRAILPLGTLTISVGGITRSNIGEYWAAGVVGFGLGSTIYHRGWSAADVTTATDDLVLVAHGLPRDKKVRVA